MSWPTMTGLAQIIADALEVPGIFFSADLETVNPSLVTAQ